MPGNDPSEPPEGDEPEVCWKAKMGVLWRLQVWRDPKEAVPMSEEIWIVIAGGWRPVGYFSTKAEAIEKASEVLSTWVEVRRVR